jgi:putative endonuclease
MFEHKHKLIGGFSKRYSLNKLVYFEEFNNIGNIIRREKQIKNWHREWKINLIESFNPEWKDFSNGIPDSEINSALQK